MNPIVEQPYDLSELRANLVVARLVAPTATLRLEEHQPTFPRRNAYRRWHYRVNSDQGILCHLVVGRGLATVHTRAEDLAAACPELVCRPLCFWQRADGMGFLCLDHFEGESLDSLVAQGRCPASRWVAFVRHAQSLLEGTSQPSTASQLIQEVQTLVDEVSSFPGLSPFDVQLLREVAQPAILTPALQGPLVRRWSNGDFVGRNLLVNAQGDLRLIDYEHAALTHFGSVDWVRLWPFSTIPSGLDETNMPEITAARQPGAEVHCWMHQLALLKAVEPTPAVMQHVADVVGWLFSALGRAQTATPAAEGHSLLLRLAAEHNERTATWLRQCTAWAKSLEQEIHALKTRPTEPAHAPEPPKSQ